MILSVHFQHQFRVHLAEDLLARMSRCTLLLISDNSIFEKLPRFLEKYIVEIYILMEVFWAKTITSI